MYVFVHHLFSVIQIPRGWRRFVFELFDEMKWGEGEWCEFDEVGRERRGDG